MPLTAEQIEQAEQERLARLSAQSVRDDVALFEIVYQGRFVKFDVSTMQAEYLTPQQLLEQCFSPAFDAVRLKTLVAESSALSSSSFSNV